jgi:hypothetical protein
MLWMVVAMTMSGVSFAGLQLYAGFKLALAGKGGFEQSGKVDIGPGRISISSSITGILVLAISLAFFYVLVKDVYLIKELPTPAARSEAGGPDLHAGWGRNNQLPTGKLNTVPEPTINPNALKPTR